jgi:hypothetical protein
VTLITDSDLSGPQGVAVDGSGNYIVAEDNTQLSRVTPGGTVTFIANVYSGPGVAIDNSGNYIVTEQSSDRLSLVTPGGTVTVITSSNLNRPHGVAFKGELVVHPRPVGGLVMSVNKFEILTPYLALAGLIMAVSAVVAVKKRRD